MIRNAGELGGTNPRDTALACLESALSAGDPARLIESTVSLDGDTLHVSDQSVDLREWTEVIVVGGGKGAGRAALGLESVLGDRIDRGLVVTTDPQPTDRIDCREGSHPIPDAETVTATRELLEIVDAADRSTLVLVLVTGGGSALLTAPAPTVDLDAIRSVTDALLSHGASIQEINAVRKHLSRIKGGHLARRAQPATTIGLLFSDVVGDDPGVIASGPTAPDRTTFADAIAVLERYGVDPPESVGTHLQAGLEGGHDETPTPEAPFFDRVTNVIVANARTALLSAVDRALELGYNATVLTGRLEGEARDAGRFHAAVGTEIADHGTPIQPPAVVVSGGETTVTVTGDGAGGPNQEFALAAAIDLRGRHSIAIAAIDTDGIDGASPAAGGLVDGATVTEPDRVEAALRSNDAYPYLEDRNAAIDTGYTGTNLNDCRLIVVEKDGH